jgi:hypothetical protein
MNRFTFEEKKKIADQYLIRKCGLTWDDLPDVNSLHDDVEDENDIYNLCDDRLIESGFPFIDD